MDLIRTDPYSFLLWLLVMTTRAIQQLLTERIENPIKSTLHPDLFVSTRGNVDSKLTGALYNDYLTVPARLFYPVRPKPSTNLRIFNSRYIYLLGA